QTELLLSGLKEYQPLIISGLAYGVDINAHRKSLQVGLSTVGVLGSGLNKIYPDAHRSTAKKMFATGGLLSVYPHWVGPEKDHFPARNRIVAMLADMVIVVESDRQGGSMITANMANEMKTPVGAFPGRHEDKKSAGCNELIKKHRAHLIESAEDVAQVLNWLKSELHNQQGKLFQDLTEEEQAIVKQLTEYPDASVDDLRKSLAWPAAKLAGKILDMELKGMLRVLPGPRYRLAY
ncbi:MAG: DNA-processing protein DprA, partial [Bacteroidota bacterium]